MNDRSHVKRTQTDRVARLTLARPPLNVLNIEMISQLNGHVEELSKRQDLCALIIDAEGPQAEELSGVPVGLSMQQMERKLIEATLERFSGHRAKTAQALGIGLRTLSGKLKEYGYAPRAKRMAG